MPKVVRLPLIAPVSMFTEKNPVPNAAVVTAGFSWAPDRVTYLNTTLEESLLPPPSPPHENTMNATQTTAANPMPTRKFGILIASSPLGRAKARPVKEEQQPVFPYSVREDRNSPRGQGRRT